MSTRGERQRERLRNEGGGPVSASARSRSDPYGPSQSARGAAGQDSYSYSSPPSSSARSSSRTVDPEERLREKLRNDSARNNSSRVDPYAPTSLSRGASSTASIGSDPDERLRQKLRDDADERSSRRIGAGSSNRSIDPEDRLREKLRNDANERSGNLSSPYSPSSQRSDGPSWNPYPIREGEEVMAATNGAAAATVGSSAIQTPDDRMSAKLRGENSSNLALSGRYGASSRSVDTSATGTPDDRIREKLQSSNPTLGVSGRYGASSRSVDTSATETPEDRMRDKILSSVRQPANAYSSSYFEEASRSGTVQSGRSDEESLKESERREAQSLGVGAVSVTGTGTDSSTNNMVGDGDGDGDVDREWEQWPTGEDDNHDEEADAAHEIAGDKLAEEVKAAFCVVCGVDVTRRACILITALLGLVIVAVVGAMAGTGAFSGGGSGGGGGDASEGLPDEEGVAPTLPPSPGPTALATVYVPPECKQSKLPRERTKGAAEQYYARKVAINGDTSFVGADMDGSEMVSRSGSVYVYTRDEGSTWTEQAGLRSNENLRGDQFGRSVAAHGDTVAVGARDDASNLFLEEADRFTLGCVYVFTRGTVSGTGASWRQQAKLLPDNIEEADVSFGSTVAVYGDTLIVGMEALNTAFLSVTNSGSAYVFTRSNDASWTQQAKIVPNNGQEGDRFGHSVGVYDNTAVIGAVRANTMGKNSGAAYVYFQSEGNWTEQAKLFPNDGAANDAFGMSVAVHDDTIAVGANSDDDNYYNSGSVYVFVRNGTEWTQQAKLLADDGQDSDSFGESVAVDGDTIVVGSRSGAAYVFGRTGTSWMQRMKLDPTLHGAGDGKSKEKYGESVDVSGDTAIIGAYTDDLFGSDIGSAYTIKFC